jgi:hypothetical protein
VEVGGFVGRTRSPQLNFMRRLIFAAVGCGWFSTAAGAQQVPGRDLLDFPLGTVAEAPALAQHAADGLWNPAGAALPAGVRVRGSAGALITPPDQGVAAQLIAAALALPRGLTGALTIVRAAVDNIVRTGSDPQSIGGDVPYQTTLYSAVIARKTRDFLTAGVALRYRTGQLDADREGALGIDGGLLAEGLWGRDVRLGLATFLWRPGGSVSDERTSFNAAGDLRAAGRSERQQLRAGYALSYTPGSGHEHYLVGSGRSGVLEARVGVARAVRFGEPFWRLRLGAGLHYARYALGVAREEAGADLGPTYQFTLSTEFK